MKTADYIQAIKRKHSYSSDYAVAKALRVPPAQMSKYVNGDVVPGPLVAARIAQVLGEQEVAVVFDLERERAEKMGKADDAQEWSAILEKIGKGAASILLGALMVGFPNADAHLARSLEADHPIHRIKPKKRGRRQAGPWDGLKRRVAAARQALSTLTGCLCPIPVPCGAP